jgi:hypothetical protein
MAVSLGNGCFGQAFRLHLRVNAAFTLKGCESSVHLVGVYLGLLSAGKWLKSHLPAEAGNVFVACALHVRYSSGAVVDYVEGVVFG